jgi:hypothetical protein
MAAIEYVGERVATGITALRRVTDKFPPYPVRLAPRHGPAAMPFPAEVGRPAVGLGASKACPLTISSGATIRQI